MSHSQPSLFPAAQDPPKAPRPDPEAADAHLAKALGLADDQDPFPWQRRLLDELLQGRIPRALDIPTGLGKTATMAAWLVARALGADVPRKLVYVVDRRAVVDQATVEAERLRDWVASSPLKAGLDLSGEKLPVSTLRGKHADNREWMDDPASAALIVGTVDMIGSRLLFEGYRSSRKIRPYLAGLLGHDTLFVLDEAHLVPPFERLMDRVSEARSDLRPDGGPLAAPPPLRVLSLSATGRDATDAPPPFRLDDADTSHPEVSRRLHATKRLTIEPLTPSDDLPKVAAERAWEHAQSLEEPVRYLLFFNRRLDAEAALGHLREFAGLAKLKKGEERQADVELLVGGRRIFERQEAQDWLGDRGFLAGHAGAPNRHTFLFATSAGEVGIDLDADHMIGDLVPWERMVQRLGRVNRRGKGDARVLVLDPPLDKKADAQDIARRDAVLELLQALPTDPRGGYDASPGALGEASKAHRDLAKAATTPAPLYPPLERATLDDWSMTSLPSHAGRPAIAPWLRGWIEDQPQTTVVWRTHLPVPEGRRPTATLVKRYFEAAPPHLTELLETESWRVLKWVNSRVKKLMKRAAAAKEEAGALTKDTVVAMTRGSRTEAWETWTLQRLDDAQTRDLERALNRAELVLDARFGGLDDTGLLDDKAEGAPVTADGPAERSFAEHDALPFRIIKTDKPDPENALTQAGHGEGWFERARFPIRWTAEGTADRWLVVFKRTVDAQTEDDRSSGPDQTLQDHQACAEKHAHALADRLGLTEQARHILATAARLHDEGKRATRWQQAFNANANGEEPLAKTQGPVNVHLLDGYRHEFGSLPYAEKDPEVQALPPEQRDLVLHLIASHHGFARPVIRTTGCEDAPPSALERRAREVALRFHRLQTRWGPWGLAWWESLLRAADQQASKENAELGKNRKKGGKDAAEEAR